MSPRRLPPLRTSLLLIVLAGSGLAALRLTADIRQFDTDPLSPQYLQSFVRTYLGVPAPRCLPRQRIIAFWTSYLASAQSSNALTFDADHNDHIDPQDALLLANAIKAIRADCTPDCTDGACGTASLGTVQFSRFLRTTGTAVQQVLRVQGTIHDYQPHATDRWYEIRMTVNGTRTILVHTEDIGQNGSFIMDFPDAHSVSVSGTETRIGMHPRTLSGYYRFQPSIENSATFALLMTPDNQVRYTINAQMPYFDPKTMQLFVNSKVVPAERIVRTNTDFHTITFHYAADHLSYKLGAHPATLYCCASDPQERTMQNSVNQPALTLMLYEGNKRWATVNAIYRRVCGNGIWECGETCEPEYRLQPGCVLQCAPLCAMEQGTVHTPAMCSAQCQ